MGWWRIQGGKDTIGDGPLDVLGLAVTEVLAEYQRAFKRRPTRSEWEALLHAVLGSQDVEHRILEEATVKGVKLEVE
jgi:hypothetical protein